MFYKYSDMQVIITGQARHSLPGSGDQVAKLDANGSVVKADQELRIYHEYLSYLFRKPELPSQQIETELQYRDYLQVSIAFFKYKTTIYCEAGNAAKC